MAKTLILTAVLCAASSTRPADAKPRSPGSGDSGLLVQYTYLAGGGLPSRSVSLRIGLDGRLTHTVTQRSGREKPRVRASKLTKAQRAELDRLLSALEGATGDVSVKNRGEVDGGSGTIRYRHEGKLLAVIWSIEPSPKAVLELLAFLRAREPKIEGGLE